VIIIIISAFITGLTQHSYPIGYLSWFSLVPLLFILNKLVSISQYIKFGFLWGIVYYFTTIFWLSGNIGTSQFFSTLSMLLAVLYCSTNIIIISLICYLFKKYYSNSWFWFFPLIWTSVEYLRNLDILAGGPWTSLANTQLKFLILIQNAEIFGMYGITFWLVLTNVLVFNFLNNKNKVKFVLLAIHICTPWITGYLLMSTALNNKNTEINITSIQPNTNLEEKWKPGRARANILSLIELSLPSIHDSVDLIIWPESATSTYLLQNRKNYVELIQSKLKNTKLLTGTPYSKIENNQTKHYNSSVLISQDSIFLPYHKLKLVPMGEYIPLSNIFPKLKSLNIGQANFTPGDEYRLFNVNGINIASMICFESTFPYLSRRFVNNGAEILTYLVNDGWYKSLPGPYQHSKQAIYRSIENRRYVIRSTNTGISMIIDPFGNIVKQLSLNRQGTISSKVYANKSVTFYTKYGDIFIQLIVFITLVSLVVKLRNKK